MMRMNTYGCYSDSHTPSLAIVSHTINLPLQPYLEVLLHQEGDRAVGLRLGPLVPLRLVGKSRRPAPVRACEGQGHRAAHHLGQLLHHLEACPNTPPKCWHMIYAAVPRKHRRHAFNAYLRIAVPSASRRLRRHMRMLIGFFKLPEIRSEVFIIFFNRITDMWNAKIWRVRFESKEEVVKLQSRLGRALSGPRSGAPAQTSERGTRWRAFERRVSPRAAI